jgi:hypothetical protein
MVAVPRCGWLHALTAIRARPIGGRSVPVRQAHTPLAGPIPPLIAHQKGKGATQYITYFEKLCGTVPRCRDAPL